MEDKATFIKIDKFETALSAMSVIKKKLAEAQNTLGKIVSLKQDEDAAVEKWTADLQAMQDKIGNMEQELLNE